ncbi:MAG TPA: hypothetical protein VKM55_29465 [Candidatus Lokiarchaeia archaeon]|nr:hypothetical protein [Candidatus Lokiarchaeia archaeon]
MEQHDFQLKVLGSKAVSGNDSSDDLREKIRAIEDVFNRDPNFSGVQVLKVNSIGDIKKIAGHLKEDFKNFREDDDKLAGFHVENEVLAGTCNMPSHPFDPSVFQVHDPHCQQCSSDLEFTIVEDLNGTGTDWIQWYCKSNCGFYYNVQLI